MYWAQPLAYLLARGASSNVCKECVTYDNNNFAKHKYNIGKKLTPYTLLVFLTRIWSRVWYEAVVILLISSMQFRTTYHLHPVYQFLKFSVTQKFIPFIWSIKKIFVKDAFHMKNHNWKIFWTVNWSSLLLTLTSPVRVQPKNVVCH